MEIASLIVSILGSFFGAISIIITLRLTKRTSELREEIKKKYDSGLAVAHFNESKHTYLSNINAIKTNIIQCIDKELSLTDLDDLQLIIKRIKIDVSHLGGEQVNETKRIINDLENLLGNTEYDSRTKNSLILDYLRDTITFLESFRTID